MLQSRAFSITMSNKSSLQVVDSQIKVQQVCQFFSLNEVVVLLNQQLLMKNLRFDRWPNLLDQKFIQRFLLAFVISKLNLQNRLKSPFGAIIPLKLTIQEPVILDISVPPNTGLKLCKGMRCHCVKNNQVSRFHIISYVH